MVAAAAGIGMCCSWRLPPLFMVGPPLETLRLHHAPGSSQLSHCTSTGSLGCDSVSTWQMIYFTSIRTFVRRYVPSQQTTPVDTNKRFFRVVDSTVDDQADLAPARQRRQGTGMAKDPLHRKHSLLTWPCPSQVHTFCRTWDSMGRAQSLTHNPAGGSRNSAPVKRRDDNPECTPQ
jgi:hypothetical protein